MLAIFDPYEAWCLDEAVQMFGAEVESEMDAARDRRKGNAKQKAAAAENMLRKMLGMKQKFRDITELMAPRSPAADLPEPKFTRE